MFTDLWQFYHAFYVSLYSLHLFPLFKTGGERGGDSNWDYLLLHMTSFFRFMGLLIFPFFHVFFTDFLLYEVDGSFATIFTDFLYLLRMPRFDILLYVRFQLCDSMISHS